MTTSYEPPTRASVRAVVCWVSPGCIHLAKLSASSQASKISSALAAIVRRTVIDAVMASFSPRACA
jgi:hypothetical protein